MSGISTMHRLFGKTEGQRCKDCDHLIRYKANRTYYKCQWYGESSSEATDWRLKYDACGLFNKPNGDIHMDVPVYKAERTRTHRSVLDNYECDGQMSIEDYLQEN